MAPEMASNADREGNYPLFIAIRNQQSYDTMLELFKTFPEIVGTKDVATNSLPFMLAAKGNWENEIDQVAIIYLLLREDPHSVLDI